MAGRVKIVINGMGVAGPALAFWLSKDGNEVVLVEQAPQRRRGGYIIDFWGVGYDIAEKMGLIGEIRALGYQVREVRFVNRKGRKCGGFDVDVFDRMTAGRFTSVRRSDISAGIDRAIDGQCRRIFGDSVARLEEDNRGLQVFFEHSPPERADLVVGTDGLHSRIRGLAFGPQSDFEVPLGYHVAAFEIAGYQPRDELVYMTEGLPGLQLSRFSMREDKTMFLLVFRSELMSGRVPQNDDARRRLLKHVFAGAGWEWPRIAEALDRAGDIYFDSVSQIRMQRWTNGRVALVGDAAACVSLLAGEGTGLAICEAYVLAGELKRSGGDYANAFARYEERLMPFLAKKQRSAANFASAFAPKTSFGLAFRNAATRLFRWRTVADYLVGRDLRDDIVLPEY
jgi:2-polyprenyl-6-methoxyphenol hydroxylase-like FAD-dependent oxidoreductase